MEISFRKIGKGKPVILIHGFCETHEIWNGFAERLAEKFEIYAIDLPGFGQSTPLSSHFSLVDIAQTILNWMDRQKIRLPFVVGHSLGGYVGLAMAKVAQQMVSGLCLFHSTPYPDTEEKKSNRNRVMEFVNKNGVDPFVDTFVPGLFFNKKHLSIPIVDKIARGTSRETLLAYTEAMRDRPSSIELLKTFEKPMLVLAGKNDTIVPVESVLDFGHLARKSEIEILNDTGHMAMFEQPEKARNIISDFLGSI
jgi:pimeloyl-ACP methyl ester carboxylesterase